MNLLEYKYENQIIEFDISGKDVMINATEMAKPFNKEPYDFLKQAGTKAFIEVLKTSIPAFRSDSQSERNEAEGDLQLQNILQTDRGGDGGSTWMHRQLALKFAAWLDPKFEVWIYQTIDLLIFGNLHKVNDSLKRKAALQDKRENIMKRLEDNPDYQDLLQVNSEIKLEDKMLRESNNNQLDLFKS